MTKFKNISGASRRLCRGALGIIPALVLGACAGSPDPQPSDRLKDFTVDTSPDGAIQRVSKLQDASAASPEGTPGDTVIDKAGCTHIRFCNAPGPDEVICDTDDNLACTPSQRLNECFSDADFVCGNWTMMTFDPPIQF